MIHFWASDTFAELMKSCEISAHCFQKSLKGMLQNTLDRQFVVGHQAIIGASPWSRNSNGKFEKFQIKILMPSVFEAGLQGCAK